MEWYSWIGLALVVIVLLRYLYHAIPTYSYWRRAKQGDPDAQYQLALRYFFGYGVGRDNAKSSYWMQKAAAQGHAKATGYCNDMIGKLHEKHPDEVA